MERNVEIFNDNLTDVLLINQSGSTGASAHAIITKRVPREKVKQRVMIVLQPELDINREVQKRGRINRTGQIYPPIYDYISSSVPAEQRLNMMLQRKLKSLDANTTSNQKQSKSLMEYPDFLNKYGDEVVENWLEAHLALAKAIGCDPEKGEITAYKTSGRIAVTPCATQKAFYDEVMEGYVKKVNYAKQRGEYDLEVEDMNLQAETLEKDVYCVGKGGTSDFGGDSYLEKVEANVLIRPFTQVALHEEIEKFLDGLSPEEYILKLVEDAKAFLLKKYYGDEKAENERFEVEKENIKSSPKYIESLDKRETLRVLTDELETKHRDRIVALRTTSENRYDELKHLFNTKKVGTAVEFEDNVPGVFLGFKINPKHTNPYAPSSMDACFALANSLRYLELPLSGQTGTAAKKMLNENVNWKYRNILNNWDVLTEKSSARRSVRYIYTGNLLQAYASVVGSGGRGKLISYTTKNGEVKKGILMKEDFNPAGSSDQKAVSRSVPLKFCRKAILSLSLGSSLQTDASVDFQMRDGGRITILSNAGQTKIAWLIKNPQILPMILENGGFQKISGAWKGTIDARDIDDFIEIMYRETNANALLSLSQYDLIEADIKREQSVSLFTAQTPPPPDDNDLEPVTSPMTSDDDEEFELIEIEAIARKRKLKLLKLKQNQK